LTLGLAANSQAGCRRFDPGVMSAIADYIHNARKLEQTVLT
jgi:hypothetical protein